MGNYLIHELEVENDRGTVETSFLFLSLVFIAKNNNIDINSLQHSTDKPH